MFAPITASPAVASASPSPSGSSELGNYRVLSKLGEGTFGRIAKVQRRSDGKVLAWKEICYADMTDRQKHMLVSEVNILRALRHPHIVRYYDRIVESANNTIFIVMEYCAGGDIAALIRWHKQRKEYIEEDFIWKVFREVAAALRACHDRNVLHRDVKPANVFLDARRGVKLGDFGLSCRLREASPLVAAGLSGSPAAGTGLSSPAGASPSANVTPSSSPVTRGDFARTFLGTPYYMSPELVKEDSYDEKSDVWALGCLVYEMATLRPPFDADNQLSLKVKIRIGYYQKIPSCYSQALTSLLRQLLCVSQHKRASLADAVRMIPAEMKAAQAPLATGTDSVAATPAGAQLPRSKSTVAEPLTPSGVRPNAAAAPPTSGPVGVAGPVATAAAAEAAAAAVPLRFERAQRVLEATAWSPPAAAVDEFECGRVVASRNDRGGVRPDPDPGAVAAAVAVGCGGVARAVAPSPSSPPAPLATPGGIERFGDGSVLQRVISPAGISPLPAPRTLFFSPTFDARDRPFLSVSPTSGAADSSSSSSSASSSPSPSALTASDDAAGDDDFEEDDLEKYQSHLVEKEMHLERRKLHLDSKELTLRHREDTLTRRERALDEKIERAEALLCQLRLQEEAAGRADAHRQAHGLAHVAGRPPGHAVAALKPSDVASPWRMAAGGVDAAANAAAAVAGFGGAEVDENVPGRIVENAERELRRCRAYSSPHPVNGHVFAAVAGRSPDDAPASRAVSGHVPSHDADMIVERHRGGGHHGGVRPPLVPVNVLAGHNPSGHYRHGGAYAMKGALGDPARRFSSPAQQREAPRIELGVSGEPRRLSALHCVNSPSA